MTISQDIINDLQDELNLKLSQKEALLSQLTLLDARIDKYDGLISNVDTDVLKIIEIINSKVTPIKTAYDARISANCRSDLAWVLVDEWQPSYSFGGFFGPQKKYYKYEVKKNSNTYSFTPYRGIKYYQKPTNRDYGTNIITTFDGAISAGSTVITILNNETQVSQLARIGDNIVDNLNNPILFSETNIPSIVGFGTTNAIGIVTTLVGGISTGSTVFAHYGSGISSVGINTGMFFECVGVVTSTIVGFGTTTFSVSFLNDNGNYEITQIPCNSIILNNSAVDGITDGAFTVGILTSYPAAFISTVSLGTTTNSLFTILRQGDIDTNFDYTQSPLEPLNIGIINSSNIGVGHSSSLDFSGNPNQTVSWRPSSSYFDSSTNSQVNPEPSVGGGRAEYYIGTLSWPTIRSCTGEVPFVTCSSTIASEGTVAITTVVSPVSLATTNSYPGVNPSGTLCNQLQQNIDNAILDLQTTLAQYENQITPLVNATKTLREDRDRKELQAWSILQALGSVTEDISRLEKNITDLINTDFSPYES